MQYSIIKDSDIKINKISFGCSNFGGIGSDPRLVGKGSSEAEAHAILNVAYDFGINYYDTATTYAAGKSEKILGKWLKANNISRDKIIISSKVNIKPPNMFGFRKKGLSRSHITKQVNSSLKRLNIDYIDIFYIHSPDPETPLIETLTALNDLVTVGKIKVLGASNVNAEYLKESLKVSRENSLAGFNVIQNSYNFIQRSDEKGLIPFCNDNNILYIAYGPLSGGLLSGKYQGSDQYPKGSRLQLRSGLYRSLLNEEVFKKIAVLKDIACKMEVSLPSLMYAWLYENSSINSLLIGPRNQTQFQSIIDAINLELTKEDYNMLSQLF